MTNIQNTGKDLNPDLKIGMIRRRRKRIKKIKKKDQEVEEIQILRIRIIKKKKIFNL